MKFESTFGPGDKAWIYSNWEYVQEVTVGQVRIEFTDCKDWEDPGCTQDRVYSGSNTHPDNYSARYEYKEEYMCQETGIGSGSVYTLNKNIFKTKEECEKAFADVIKEKQERLQRVKQQKEEEARKAYDYQKLCVLLYEEKHGIN